MERSTQALMKKELLQLLRSRQLLLFFVAEVALAVASFSLAARQWAREAESGRLLAEANQRRLATLNSWSDVEDTGILVSPPAPAGRFLVSTQPWPGFLVSVPELPTPLGALDREALPPPSRVLLVFYSLFALLLSFDAVGAEKTQRTLGLLLAAAGSRRRLLEVKFVVRAGVVASVTVVSLLLAALGTSARAPEFVTDPSFLRIFPALVVFLAAHATLFVAVALMISCLFPEPLTSLLAGVGAWVVVVIALPGAGEAVANALVPPPSRTLIDAQATALYARHRQRSDEAMVEPLRRWLREGPAAQQWFEEEANRIRRQLRAELQQELLALFDGYVRAERRSATVASRMAALFPTGLYMTPWRPWRELTGAASAATCRE